MRTNVDIDESLVEQAFALTHVRSKRELIDLALRELIRIRQRKSMRDLIGEVQFADDFDPKAMRALRGLG